MFGLDFSLLSTAALRLSEGVERGKARFASKKYAAQAQRYDFESFDDAYMELTPLQNYIVSYIKANISEF